MDLIIYIIHKNLVFIKGNIFRILFLKSIQNFYFFKKNYFIIYINEKFKTRKRKSN